MITTTCGNLIGIGRAQDKPSLSTIFVPEKGEIMSQTRKSQTRKPQSPNRGQRHSAAWGKRLSMLLLLVLAEAAFAQVWEGDGKPVGKFAPDLAAAVARAHQGTAGNETARLIVRYKQ